MTLLTENDVRRIIRQELKGALYGTATVHQVEDGKASLLVAGETKPTTKKYKCVGSYIPEPGDRVEYVKQSGTYVIMGKLG